MSKKLKEKQFDLSKHYNCIVLFDHFPDGYNENKIKINSAPHEWHIISDSEFKKDHHGPRVVLLNNPYIPQNVHVDLASEQWRNWKDGKYYWDGGNFYEFDGKLYLEGGSWRC